MSDSDTKNGWTVEQLEDKKFLITNNATSKTYTIESDLLPSGIDILGTNHHLYVEKSGGVDTSQLGGSGGMRKIVKLMALIAVAWLSVTAAGAEEALPERDCLWPEAEYIPGPEIERRLDSTFDTQVVLLHPFV